jgi:hypothetical protein
VEEAMWSPNGGKADGTCRPNFPSRQHSSP